MKLIVVAVRDRAADTFGRPFYVRAVGEAIRSFSDEINRAAPDNSLYLHPEDFDLYLIGEYIEATGNLMPAEELRMLAIGKDTKIRKEEE